jgi:hypothetical protein
VTWIKLDDGITEHRRFVGLSPNAWCLWLHGITYCSRNLTDGQIPAAMVPRLTAMPQWRKALKELVDGGLWLEVEGGFQVDAYLEHQRSKAQVTADREAAAERQQRARDKRKASQGESRRDDGVSHGSVTRLDTETETDVTTPLPPFVSTRSVDNRSASHGHYPWTDEPAVHPAVAQLHQSLGINDATRGLL